MKKLVIAVQNRAADLRTEEDGATMVEYGLMVALIAVVVAGGAAILGTNVDTLFRGLTFP